MKQLVRPARIPEIKEPNHIAKQIPLLDGQVVMAKTAKQKRPGRMGLTAITSLVMLAALSQAPILVGCAKTAAEPMQKQISKVAIDTDSNQDQSAGGAATYPTELLFIALGALSRRGR